VVEGSAGAEDLRGNSVSALLLPRPFWVYTKMNQELRDNLAEDRNTTQDPKNKPEREVKIS
jgi:hypothetical protein